MTKIVATFDITVTEKMLEQVGDSCTIMLRNTDGKC